jgi:hypothetical protein|tara:strand:- start:657 stop:857 length:201 start_codon:yes stop_codon:yes gene_type:complete
METNEPIETSHQAVKQVLQSHSGVDKTLLAWMASKTPEQRLKILQNNVTAILKARNGRCKSKDSAK